MKILRQLLSDKLGRYLVGIFILLFLISNWISYRPEPKITRQIGSSSDDMQVLWTRKMYLWDHVADWKTNAIYVVDFETGKLLAIDGLTGETVWSTKVPFGARDLLIGDQAVFAVTSYVSAFRTSTGKWLWTTKLDDAHASIYAQEEDSLLRVYYGKKIFEVSQASGEIISEQPKDDIVWVQNDIEIRCLPLVHQDETVQDCWIGLIGIDRATGKTLWKNNKPVYSEYYQEPKINNMIFVESLGNGICSLKPETGGYHWCLPQGKISNIAIDNDGTTGYFLRHDFSLVKINLLTGGILAETQFLPTVLPEGILPEGMEKEDYGYSVAVTKDTVIVSFRDSDQTFGLRFDP